MIDLLLHLPDRKKKQTCFRYCSGNRTNNVPGKLLNRSWCVISVMDPLDSPHLADKRFTFVEMTDVFSLAWQVSDLASGSITTPKITKA